MKATIKQATNNDRDLRISFEGRGGYGISCIFRNKYINCYSTNSIDIDNFKSQDSKRIKEGYENLINEIIYKNAR